MWCAAARSVHCRALSPAASFLAAQNTRPENTALAFVPPSQARGLFFWRSVWLLQPHDDYYGLSACAVLLRQLLGASGTFVVASALHFARIAL
jgi:hypothetical protein